MASLIENGRVNSGRQPELDIARGLAVLFMIAVHTLEVFSSGDVVSSPFGLAVGFLGSPPAAPVFMFLLGAGIVYSRKAEPAALLKRGALLLLAGYLLNALRGSIPYLVGHLATGDPEFLAWSWKALIMVDIFQFAGLTFIFFAAFMALKAARPDAFWPALVAATLSLAALNLLLMNMEFGSPVPSPVSGLFLGVDELSFFPFLSWFVYPVAGFVFGSVLIRCGDKRRLYTLCLVSGLALTVMFAVIFMVLLGIDVGINDEYNYYHHAVPGNLIFLSFVLFWLGLLHFLSGLITGAAGTTLARWSGNVSSMYFIHWVFIGLLAMFIYPNSAGLVPTIVLILGLLVCSDLLSAAHARRRKAALTAG